MPSYKYQDFIFSLLMLVAGLALVVHSYSDAYTHSHSGNGALEPMFYPRLVLWLWCASSLVMALRALRLSPKIRKSFNGRQVCLALGMMTGMLALMLAFGFMAGAAPFVASFAILLGYRHKWRLAIASLLIPLFLYVLFEHALGIMLPSPLWDPLGI